VTEWSLTSAFMLMVFYIGNRIEKKIKKKQPSREENPSNPIQKVFERMLIAVMVAGAIYFGFINEGIISSELYFLSATVIFFSLSAWMEWRLDQNKSFPLLTLLQLGTSLALLIIVCIIQMVV
jgi:uncharacterized protein involved in response to NO